MVEKKNEKQNMMNGARKMKGSQGMGAADGTIDEAEQRAKLLQERANQQGEGESEDYFANGLRMEEGKPEKSGAFPNDKKIEVVFKSKSLKYSISDAPVFIPIKLKRYGLSQVINHLLSLENHVPFDFIINEKFLVGSIESYLDANGLSTENTLPVEFIELSLPPKKSASLLQDDWISTISISKNLPIFLAGSFDGVLRIWNEQGKVLDSISLTGSCIKSSIWINHEIALIGDSLSNVFAYRIVAPETGSCLIEKLYKCSTHQGSISHISVNQDSTKFATASWDKTIKLWSSDIDDCTENMVAKKSNKKQKIVPELLKSELVSLHGHSGAVSSVLFDPLVGNHIYSGSWDHSVRLWDVEMESNLMTLNSEKVVVSMIYCDDLKLLVTGHEDGVLRMWDPRSRDGMVLRQNLSMHKNWISSLAKSPSQGFHIASASYDGTVKVADIRSTIPLYSLSTSEDSSKLYALDWKKNFLITGGEDSKIHIFCP